jgi:hypothetical protein
MANYLPYIFNNGNNVLGHYRASTGLQTSTGQVAGNGIVFGGVWGGVNLAAILRVQIGIEIKTNVTTAQNFNFNLYSFRAATGKYTGTSATHASSLQGAQMRTNMPSTQWLTGANGDFCSLGGSLTGLTAAAGKSNSGSPIGSTTFGTLFNSSSTGTAVLITAGAAVAPAGPADLFSLQPGISHPLILTPNDGIEIQQITATGAGTLNYIVVVEWAEILNL